jgi:hypothetical protein
MPHGPQLFSLTANLREGITQCDLAIGAKRENTFKTWFQISKSLK